MTQDKDTEALRKVAEEARASALSMGPADEETVGQWHDRVNAAAMEFDETFSPERILSLLSELEAVKGERTFDAWLIELEEDVIQGEFGYEPGEFTVYPEHWRRAFDDGLKPHAAFQRALDAMGAARKADEALQEMNRARIQAEDRATVAEAALASLKEERDEADRRAGNAERRLDQARERELKERQWLDSAKIERGASINDSFDVVWAETCALADRAQAAEQALSVLKGEMEEAREIAKRVPALEFELRAKVAELEIADGEIERLKALVIELRNALVPEGYNDLQGTINVV